jgi:HlyD family secretion protein
MNTQRFFNWKRVGAAAVTLVLATTVVRAVSGQPSTVARPSDAARSARVLANPNARAEPQREPASLGWISGNAVIEPADREVRIAAAVPGRVREVLVQEGARVHRGDALIELDAEPERAALAAAEADVAVSRAELTRTQRGNRREDQDASIAEADAARARAELSSSQLARTEALSRSGNATQDELDRARRQAEIDRASLRQLDARRRAVVSGSRREDVSLAVARLRAAEARREQARATLERLTVRAPMDAEVLQLKVRAGEYASPSGDPLMVLGDTRTLRARIDVDEREFAGITVGADGYVLADAFGARRFSGRVVDVARRFGRRNLRTDDPAERVDTKVLEVVLALNEREPLLPGQRVVGFVASRSVR